MASSAAQATAPLCVSCLPDNDICRALESAGADFSRFDTPADAVAAAAEGAGVLILASGYPNARTQIAPELFEQARRRDLRLYVEYPAELPGMDLGDTANARWERGVVSSDLFTPGLSQLDILDLHDCKYIPVDAPGPLLVLARVAGMDTAVYGLPEDAAPLLFELPGYPALIATTKLSACRTSRYSPSDAWPRVWSAVLRWLCRDTAAPELQLEPTVRPSFGRDEPLPDDFERQALKRGVDWFANAGMLAPSSIEREVVDKQYLGKTSLQPDGSHGVYEGLASRIYPDGTQPAGHVKRSDCNGETAMGFAFGGEVLGDPGASQVAGNILDYWLNETIVQKLQRADPEHPAYGLICWGTTSWDWEKAFYGDDNARFLLGLMASASLLETGRWDEAMLKCLLANLRTTGRLGFRRNRIDQPDLEAAGWRSYYEQFVTSYAPHYQAHLWACYLWAYDRTGFEPFLDRARTAIRMTMAAYPDQWHWTNGIAQERARMLLPLAWLIRVEDKPEYREWLRRVAEDLLATQDRSGAIGEQLGKPGMGSYRPPISNEEYGTREASLIQQDGQPVCDLLYTTNFAFIGLHEAAAATGDEYYLQAENRLTEFLCRAQIRSESHPELDGGWYRCFHFGKWDFWGSNADLGWGVWSIETGWTQGWIAAVLGLRQMRTSLWDLTADSDVGRHTQALVAEMFPDGYESPELQLLTHLASGKPVSLETLPAPAYSGGGGHPLTDGVTGADDHQDPAWCGWEGADLVATVDLGEEMTIASVSLHCLQATRWGIWLPVRVECEVSPDGVQFRPAGAVDPAADQRKAGPFSEMVRLQFPVIAARHVRVRARNLGTIPDWHPASGRESWLFVDEIQVE